MEVAASKPEDLSFVHEEKPPEPTGIFRSSETFAVAVTVATVAFIFATFVALWTNWTAVDLRAAGEPEAAATLLRDRIALLALAPICAVLALACYRMAITRR